MSVISYRQFINRHLPSIERGCTSKALFVSRREASAMSRHGRHQDGAVRPYHCATCNGWHLGHRRWRG